MVDRMLMHGTEFGQEKSESLAGQFKETIGRKMREANMMQGCQIRRSKIKLRGL